MGYIYLYVFKYLSTNVYLKYDTFEADYFNISLHSSCLSKTQ